MKLKNIKNSVIVLNSVLICKGVDNPTIYDCPKTKFTVENIYGYLCEDITNTSDKIIKNVKEFRSICKENEKFIKKIIENDLKNLKEEDKKIKLNTTMFGTVYISGPLNGYFVCKNINKKAYTVDDSIKRYLVDLVIDSLKNELIEKLENLDNKYNTKKELNVEIDELKKDEKYKYIIDFEEIKSKIESIKLKEDKHEPNEEPVDKLKHDESKHKTGKNVNTDNEKNKKEQDRLNNEKLNSNLKNLKKSIEKYKSIASTVIIEELKKCFKENKDEFIKEENINEGNKELLKEIKQEIQKRGLEEMNKADKNKNDEQKKSDLIKSLTTIKNNSKDKKSSDIELEFNIILKSESYEKFSKEKEISKLVEEINEIIIKKKEEEIKEKEKEHKEEEEEEEEGEEETDGKKTQVKTDVKKEKGCSGKGNGNNNGNDKKKYSGKKK